jgi:TonB family protein
MIRRTSSSGTPTFHQADSGLAERFTETAMKVPAIRSMKEQGKVEIRLCHDEYGRVTDTRLAQSSGFERLDQAALQMGRHYRIKPVVIDGKPQPDCVVVPVKFSLTKSQEPEDRGEGGAIQPESPPVRLVPLTSESGRR